jgi:hypothetical protein
MSPYIRFAPGAAVILLLVNLSMLVMEVVVGGTGLTAVMFSMIMKILTGMGDEFRSLAKASSILALGGVMAAIPTFLMAAFYFRVMRQPAESNPAVVGWSVSILFHGVAVWFSSCIVPGTMSLAGAQVPLWVFNALGVGISVAMVAACRVRRASTVEAVEDSTGV